MLMLMPMPRSLLHLYYSLVAICLQILACVSGVIPAKHWTILHFRKRQTVSENPCLAIRDPCCEGVEHTLIKTNGMGMKAIEMKASVLLAQPTPRSMYIAEAKRGKPMLIILVSIHSRYTKYRIGKKLTSAKSRPHKIIPRQHRSGVSRIGVGEVIENTVEKKESSDREP